MNTLIELYDTNVVFNISAAAALKPENIIFICGTGISNSRKSLTRAMLSKHSPDSTVKFIDVNPMDEASVKEAFDKISAKKRDCALELTGGTELLAYMAGKFTDNMNAFIYRPKSGKLTYVSGPDAGKTLKCRISLDIRDFAYMAKGRYLRHGHFDVETFDKDIFSDAKKVWEIFLKYKDEWHKQVSFFQAISAEDSLYYNGPKAIRVKLDSFLFANTDILSELSRAGVIKDFALKGEKISFKFKNHTIKTLLNDFGVWLEIHIYKSVVDSGKFDDALMSVIIDWNDKANEPDDVFNEIDVVVIKGVTPLFISCKAGIVSTAALNEIKVLTERFGSDIAKAVLVTTTDLSEISAKTYRRAVEMGIRVIDLSDLQKSDPADLLERIMING